MADSISGVGAIGGAEPSHEWLALGTAPRDFAPLAAGKSEQAATAAEPADAALETELIEMAALAVFNFVKEQVQKMKTENEARIKEVQDEEG
jgi:hypothetical protein